MMKTVKIRSAIPIYLACAVWILSGLLFRLYSGGTILITALISAGAYFAGDLLLPKRSVQVRERANSGDAAIDAQIEEGRKLLENLKTANAAIDDQSVSNDLDRMTKAGDAIFKALEKDVRRAGDVRRFMNYYLPTADKLLSRYREMMEVGARGQNIESVMGSVEKSLGMIASAFEKQLDALYRDEALDVATDIDALEAILAGEGLTQREGQNMRGPVMTPDASDQDSSASRRGQTAGGR